jgi:hypothetical protein
MWHKILYKLCGYLSLLTGIAAALCIFRLENISLGIGLSILGFILSGINIFINVRHYSHEEKYPKGYLGMVFSSLPVLFLLFVIFRFRH